MIGGHLGIHYYRYFFHSFKKCEKKNLSVEERRFWQSQNVYKWICCWFVQTNTVNASVDQLWLTLKDKIQSTMEYVPSKMTSSRFSQPWITGHLKRLARKKKRCYNKAKRSNSKDQKWGCRGAYSKYINNIIGNTSPISAEQLQQEILVMWNHYVETVLV